MDHCECFPGFGPPDDTLLQWQYVSDAFIALAYFSIPLELVYFVKKATFFPYRWVLVQFGAFIILCGLTHMINLWTFGMHSRSVAVIMTVAKGLTAIVSCATAVMLVHIIPDLLSVKVREMFLRNKAGELDRELGMMKTAQETGRHVRMLTHEIRSSLDRHTILRTTIGELARTLQLEECMLWMPQRSGADLQLTHQLHPPSSLVPITLAMNDPTVQEVMQSGGAIEISPTSTLALAATANVYPVQWEGGPHSQNGFSGAPLTLTAQPQFGDAVAIRVPLLHMASFNDGEEGENQLFAIMVLMLPGNSARRWHQHELEIVEVVADQVAVALSHAAILEESLRSRDQLQEQNVNLDGARREAEKAIQAKNDFLAVMNHEMRTPMHAIIALSSLLQESELTPEQRSWTGTVLKSANLLATLINDVLDLSRLEDGSLELDAKDFNLHMVFKEVINLVKPIASVKKLLVSQHIAPDVPELVTGDDKRLMQTALNVVGNAVKFTKEGSVSMAVCLERPELERDPNAPEFHPVNTTEYIFIRVQVKDTGRGVDPTTIPKLFNKFAQPETTGGRSGGGAGLGLAICKRFVSLMDGHIWLESEGIGKGSTVTFVVKLGVPISRVEAAATSASPSLRNRTDFAGVKVLVTDDNSVNRMVTRGLLIRLGCDVTVVGSGRECLAAIAQPDQNFQVLLLDVLMPDMDGYEVATRIQERLKRDERPLMVALTANTDKRTREKCLRLGMDGVLLKPISLEKMRRCLNEILTTGSLSENKQ